MIELGRNVAPATGASPIAGLRVVKIPTHPSVAGLVVPVKPNPGKATVLSKMRALGAGSIWQCSERRKNGHAIADLPSVPYYQYPRQREELARARSAGGWFRQADGTL
jgi:hypothetical protein